MLKIFDFYSDCNLVFVPFGVRLENLELFVNGYCGQGKTVNEYYYFIDDKFYLLDRSLIKLYKLSVEKLRKVFRYGQVSGDVYVISWDKLGSWQDWFLYRNKDYGFGQVLVQVENEVMGKERFDLSFLQSSVSCRAYFVADKGEISKILDREL